MEVKFLSYPMFRVYIGVMGAYYLAVTPSLTCRHCQLTKVVFLHVGQLVNPYHCRVFYTLCFGFSIRSTLSGCFGYNVEPCCWAKERVGRFAYHYPMLQFIHFDKVANILVLPIAYILQNVAANYTPKMSLRLFEL